MRTAAIASAAIERALEIVSQAYAVLARTISVQAITLSYVDILTIGSFIVAALVPLVLLMKRKVYALCYKVLSKVLI